LLEGWKGSGNYIEKTSKQLKKELQEYRKAGIQLQLNGKPSDPQKIAKACSVEEENNYMRDYIRDESDKLRIIGFDRIKDI